MKVAVQITTTNSSIPIPKYQTEGAAGFDLATAEEEFINPHSHKVVSTGLIVQTPPGHMLMLVARSSLYKRFGLILTNSVGIIDEDYAGEGDVIQLSLKSDRDHCVIVPQGTRIAQGVFVPITRAQFTESEVQQSKAQRGGWGSTG
jgi:dUTP pyrophosphatase